MQAVRQVFVTGATGFVGHAVLQRLCAAGYPVRCLVRQGSEAALRGQGAIARIEGDVLDRRSLEEGMAGCDAVIHLVGIIREHPTHGVTFDLLHTQATQNVLEAATAAGIRRYLHMSALGTRPGAAARYHQTKWAAEEAVRASGLEWTIFRPSIIYGRGDGLMTLLASMIRRLPAVPVIGSGRQRLQPVPVEQVAAGFVGALDLAATIKQTYAVGGPEPVTMIELLDLIGRVLGRRRVLRVHVPVGVMRPVARVLHPLPGFPVTPDQLLMLGEDSVCDPRPFFKTFTLEPIPLAVGLERMLTK
jgi:NADH dehydrogenase